MKQPYRFLRLQKKDKNQDQQTCPHCTQVSHIFFAKVSKCRMLKFMQKLVITIVKFQGKIL